MLYSKVQLNKDHQPGLDLFPLRLLGIMLIPFSLKGVTTILLLCAGIVFAQTNLSKMQLLAKERYGALALSTVSQWHTLIEENKGLPDLEKITQVNAFFNQRIHFLDDNVVWGKNDYWATPLETMGRMQGDCEDFSIAKYITLQLMGIPINKLRMTYVRARIGGPYSKITQAHMVLSYYPQARAIPLLLDNLINDILPASQRPDLTPVYGFNSEGLWVGGASNPIINNPSSRLSRWRNLLSRMQQEGLK